MDTIFALSSGRPPAAVSVIRISGPRAHDAGRSLAGSLPDGRAAALRELRNSTTGELLDQALVLRFDSPASATGEDVVEFQCHGGRAVAEAVLGALASLDGVRMALPGEFTRRAFENGRIDLTAAEGLADLIEAETQSQRKAALALAEGGLARQIAAWQKQLLALSARAERAIDYDDDDLPIDPSLARECHSLETELRQWLARPRIEPLKDGVKVVIAGPPNAGKSSLINAIVGEDRVIVTPVPGTTRDHIEIPLALGGAPILLTDTAGLRDADDPVEALGVARAEKLVESADLLVWLGSPGEAPIHGALIAVHSKADLAERGVAPLGSLAVSSLTGDGVPELLQAIETRVSAMLPPEGAVALNRRQASLIADAADALAAATTGEVVFLAEALRAARSAFDQLTGRAGMDDVLDALFARFCLGK